MLGNSVVPVTPLTPAITPTSTTPGTSSVTQSEFITKGELHNLFKVEVEKANKVVAVVDFQHPYPTRVLAKPYPMDYIDPRFRKFDGKKQGKCQGACCRIFR